MKALLFQLAIVLIGCSSLAAQTNSDGNRSGLIGPVRSLRIKESKVLDPNNPSSTSPKVILEILTFDEKGSTTSQTVYDHDGSLKWKFAWKYTYDGDKEIRRSYFNAAGQLTNTGVTIYDEQGRKFQTTQINPNGSINHIRTYAYDNKGNIIQETHRNADGTTRVSIIRRYNDDGQVVEETVNNAHSDLVDRKLYSYDDHKTLTGFVVHKADGTSLLMVKRSYSYDAKGNIIKAVHYARDGSVESKETFTYEFDTHGNWTRRNTTREVLKDGGWTTESEIRYVEIEYY